MAAPSLEILNHMLTDVLSATERSKPGSVLAETLGAEFLLFFVRDPELAVMLPALGFPQTIPSGREWQRFLDQAQGEKPLFTVLPSPYHNSRVPVAAVVSHDMTVVLIGGHPDSAGLRKLQGLIPLAAQYLLQESHLNLAKSQIRQMSAEIEKARIMAKALNQLRKELEKALALAEREKTLAEKARQELTKANAALTQATNAATRANRAKSIFLANMSHELRTPLTAIIGYAELLHDIVTEEETREDLSRICSAGRHLLTLVNDILDMSKIEAGKVEVRSVPFHVSDVVNHAIEAVRPNATATGNVLLLDMPEDVPEMHTDEDKLRQILINLLANAAKFTTNGSITVTVSVHEQERAITIAVVDTGIGIPKERFPRLFQEFAQLEEHGKHREFPGTGLGLAISSRLAALLGGRISVESEVGKGSTFSVYVPMDLPQKKPSDQVPATAEN